MARSRAISDTKHKKAVANFDLKFKALNGQLLQTKSALKLVNRQLYHLTHWAEHVAEVFADFRNAGTYPPPSGKKHGSDKPDHPPPPWPPGL